MGKKWKGFLSKDLENLGEQESLFKVKTRKVYEPTLDGSQDKKRRKWTFYLHWVIVVVAVIGLIVSGIGLYMKYTSQEAQRKIQEEVHKSVNLPDFNQIKDLINQSQVEAVQKIKESLLVDFKEIKKINTDVVAYIVIPNTNIKYPIVQRKGEDFYYERRDIQGNFNVAGSIFLDGTSDSNFNQLHTIIYGHNMKDQTMFGQITKYFNADFYKEHNIGYLVKEDGTFYVLELLAAGTIQWDSFIYKDQPQDYRALSKFVTNIRNYAKHYSTANVPKDISRQDRILTLSTCNDFDLENTRDLLHFNMVKLDELFKVPRERFNID